jgi:hypothetical protein
LRQWRIWHGVSLSRRRPYRPVIPIDFAANAASLGAYAVAARTYDQLATALAEAKKQPRTSVVVVETDYNDRVPGYDSWWDVPIAEVSESQAVQEARAAYIEAVKKERYFWPASSFSSAAGAKQAAEKLCFVSERRPQEKSRILADLVLLQNQLLQSTSSACYAVGEHAMLILCGNQIQALLKNPFTPRMHRDLGIDQGRKRTGWSGPRC